MLWNDPALGIDWPVREPLLSKKDAAGLPLAAIAARALAVARARHEGVMAGSCKSRC